MQENIRALCETLPACAGMDAAALDVFCAAALAELTARLKEGVTAQELGERFVTAAALLAASLCAAAGETGETALKAGNVSVSAGAGGQAARQLRDRALEMLSGCLTEQGFDFRGVPL